MSWRVALLFFVLGVLTRIPFQTDNLWAHDSVLYARAIDHFDPLDQRPQAPGYLYYVQLLRAVDALTLDANRAMTVVSLVAGALAIALLYLLAARLYDERTARASALFLLTAVTFWAYGGVAYPYTLLAALSIGCALLFWSATTSPDPRGPRLAVASAAYGLAIGFRSDLAIFLAPLWLLAAWSVPLVWSAVSAALVTALVTIWFVASASLGGGVASFLQALREQGQFVDERYSVFGNGARALSGNLYELTRYLGRGLYFITPLAAMVAVSATARRVELRDRRRAAFVLFWTFTPLLIYIPIHIGEYGYVFSMIPGLCIIAARGAIALARGLRMPRTFPWIVATVALANATIFLVSDTPLSARDVARRDRGLSEKIERLARPDLDRAYIVAAYDGLLVEHYYYERLSPGLHPLHAYDPARPPFEFVFPTHPCDSPGLPDCADVPVLVVWDDLIKVAGTGWEDIRMPHGARLRVARNVGGLRVAVDGLTVRLDR